MTKSELIQCIKKYFKIVSSLIKNSKSIINVIGIKSELTSKMLYKT